jgi:tetratricopeptide (TPR) repeat protein
LHSEGKTDAAREYLQRAVELDCTDPEPFLILGREAVETGSTRGARSLIQEAVGKAVQLFNMYRMQAAREMDLADSQDPEMLAHLKTLSQQSERPQQLLEESLSLLTELYSDPEQLIDDLRRLADWYSSSPEVQTVLAQQLTGAGYLDQALSERVPFYYKAHLGLAGCYRQTGKLTPAALSGRRALDLAPGEPKVYRELREIYQEMGKPEVYLQVLELQLLKKKYNPLLFRQAAEAAEEVGKTEAAERYRRRAQSLESGKN